VTSSVSGNSRVSVTVGLSLSSGEPFTCKKILAKSRWGGRRMNTLAPISGSQGAWRAGSLPGVRIIEGCPDLELAGSLARGWTGSCKCPMLIRSGCFGAGFDEGEPLVAEVGDDLQAAAEGFDVGGQGTQFGSAGLWCGWRTGSSALGCSR